MEPPSDSDSDQYVIDKGLFTYVVALVKFHWYSWVSLVKNIQLNK